MIIMLLVLCGFFLLYCKGYSDFEAIKESRTLLKALVKKYYVGMLSIFVLIYAITVALFLPLGVPLSVLAGYFFGVGWGMVSVALSVMIGVIFLVVIARSLVPSSFFNRYHVRIDSIVEVVPYLILVRSLFIIPASVVNSVLVFSNIPIHIIAWTTFIGMFPLALLLCSVGKQLDEIDSYQDIMTSTNFLILLSMSFLIIISLLLRKRFAIFRLFTQK